MTKRFRGFAAGAVAAAVAVAGATLAAPAVASGPRLEPGQGTQGMPAAKHASSVSDAIQLLQLGAAELVVIPDDQESRKVLQAQTKQSTRVRTTVRTLAELGGDGCKRIELAFEALDLPVQTKDGTKGLWTMLMQWSVCNGGLPPESR